MYPFLHNYPERDNVKIKIFKKPSYKKDLFSRLKFDKEIPLFYMNEVNFYYVKVNNIVAITQIKLFRYTKLSLKTLEF